MVGERNYVAKYDKTIANWRAEITVGARRANIGFKGKCKSNEAKELSLRVPDKNPGTSNI